MTFFPVRLTIAPIRHANQAFTPELRELSPGFVKIYNQSSAAEDAGLDEIAGIGYRKAVEFLIKDYCIHEHPDDAEKVKMMFLSKCIETYIQQPSIKTLATRIAWLGNDEGHYVRRVAGRDIEDLKRFIDAMTNYIQMELIVQDADSIHHA
jgi:hypothetical protein